MLHARPSTNKAHEYANNMQRSLIRVFVNGCSVAAYSWMMLRAAAEPARCGESFVQDFEQVLRRLNFQTDS
jgi:hypothetical protein